MSDRRASDERRRSPPRSLSRSRSPANGRRESRYRSRSPSRDRMEPDYQEEDINPGDNLFVTGLANKTENQTLEDLFSKHGSVRKVEIMYDPHSRESRGFGFIQMASAEDADRAIDAMNGQEIDGRNITVEKAKRSKARTPTPGRYHGPPKRGRHRMDPRDYRYRESRYDRPPRGYDRPYDRPYDYYDRYDRGGGGGGGDRDRYGGSGGGGGGRSYDRYDRYDRYQDRYDRRPPPPRYDPYPRPRSPY
ncbi:hypothetical protein BC940DRAFT_91414 [Gongronella butleri]|nr:hypothetical protein BC940DRAFT_91414 [Gongronella butleri]